MAIEEIGLFDDDNEAVGVDIDLKESKKINNVQPGVWENTKRVPIVPPIECKIPQDIVIIMRSIELEMKNSSMGNRLEFGIFIKGVFTDDGKFKISKDFYIPQQKVTYASIDFQEDPPEGYNGVIHRHPNGCSTFSGVDQNSINKNFDFSLLYVDNDIKKGILNLQIQDIRIQLELKIVVMYPVFELQNNILEKIKEVIPPKPKQDNTKLISQNNGIIDRRDIKNFLINDNLTDDGTALGNIDFLNDDIIDDSPVYTCNHCGEFQNIDVFPTMCESCDQLLTEFEVVQIKSVSDIESTDEQIRFFEKIKDGELFFNT